MVMPLISEKTVQISGNGSVEVEREETVVVEMPQGINFLRLFEDEIDKLRAPFVSSTYRSIDSPSPPRERVCVRV
ncbi:hypothetical protein RHMOL_Rhmol01G0226200 [Rhododendron molle]|uniref:Uncharacterized protein n=1 Tax=Rhododendron molle TaxID=49168 RepID=A0ACC0Q4W6_RHOML|nr:hypothetical protein RHMOL_Rhmol01G0226200 [Rhododendron molle]